MSRLNKEAKKESEIIFDPLKQPVIQDKLQEWNTILASCYGPNGRNIAIQNSVGGQVSITRTSSRLFELTRPTDPILQIIFSSIKHHLINFSDFGLFTALFTSELLLNFDKIDLPATAKSTAVEYFGKIIIDHLSSDTNKCCSIKVDITNLKHLMIVVKSILNSKLLPILSQDEINFISSLILEAFLSLLPKESEQNLLKLGKLHFLKCEGLSVSHSKFYSGFLHPVPSKFNPKCITNKNEHLKIALFNVSLSGDLPVYVDVTYEVSNVNAIEDCVLNQLFSVVEKLIKFGVNVLACQKVIHPKLMKFCWNRGIIVLERLGAQGCRTFAELTNCKPIGSFNEGLQSENFGSAESINFLTICEKNFVHVENFSSSAGSLLLCQTNEECLSELNAVCKQSFKSLILLLSDSNVLIGGNCLQQHLMQVVKKMVSLDTQNGELIENLQLTNGQLLQALKGFNQTQRKLLRNLTDDECSNIESNDSHFPVEIPASSNLTNINCSCKCKQPNLDLCLNETSVVDVKISKLAAMKTVFQLSSMLLRVGMCVLDIN